jgi:fatty acid amide hydrolase
VLDLPRSALSLSRDAIERAAIITELGSAGLPVGVQVISRRWHDDLALTVMAALEEKFLYQADSPARPPLF